MKRFLIALLALVLVLGAFAFTANADNRPSSMICTERKWHWFGNW